MSNGKNVVAALRPMRAKKERNGWHNIFWGFEWSKVQIDDSAEMSLECVCERFRERNNNNILVFKGTVFLATKVRRANEW